MTSSKHNGFIFHCAHLDILQILEFWHRVPPQISISCSIYFEIHLVSQNYINENMFITEELHYLQFIFLSIIMLYFKKGKCSANNNNKNNNDNSSNNSNNFGLV